MVAVTSAGTTVLMKTRPRSAPAAVTPLASVMLRLPDGGEVGTTP